MVTMKNTVMIIGMALIVTFCLYIPNPSIVVGKEKPFEPKPVCDVLSGGQYVRCCQSFTGDDGNLKNYCTLCENTNPPSNCTERFEPRNQAGEDVGVPPTEGVSDDPQAGDNPSPGIPPTEGVEDETENENTDTPTNTIPRKGGNGLDASGLNDNVIVQ